MGLASALLKVASTTISKFRGAPGQQVVVKGKGLGQVDAEAEVYPPSGLLCRPPKGSKVLLLPIAGGKTQVAIGAVNYQIQVPLDEGETMLLSSSSDGQTLKARVICHNDGLVEFRNQTRSLKTILETLVEHLRDLTTINCVSGAPVTLSPATIAQLNADISALSELLKE